MQVAPVENPSLGRAISHIYRVSPGLAQIVTAADPQDSGFGGFFAGSALRVSRKAASSAIAWTTYEGLLLLFHAREKARHLATPH